MFLLNGNLNVTTTVYKSHLKPNKGRATFNRGCISFESCLEIVRKIL